MYHQSDKADLPAIAPAVSEVRVVTGTVLTPVEGSVPFSADFGAVAIDAMVFDCAHHLSSHGSTDSLSVPAFVVVNVHGTVVAIVAQPDFDRHRLCDQVD